jgi:hypothetical protein
MRARVAFGHFGTCSKRNLLQVIFKRSHGARLDIIPDLILAQGSEPWGQNPGHQLDVFRFFQRVELALL